MVRHLVGVAVLAGTQHERPALPEQTTAITVSSSRRRSRSRWKATLSAAFAVVREAAAVEAHRVAGLDRPIRVADGGVRWLSPGAPPHKQPRLDRRTARNGTPGSASSRPSRPSRRRRTGGRPQKRPCDVDPRAVTEIEALRTCGWAAPGSAHDGSATGRQHPLSPSKGVPDASLPRRRPSDVGLSATAGGPPRADGSGPSIYHLVVPLPPRRRGDVGRGQSSASPPSTASTRSSSATRPRGSPPTARSAITTPSTPSTPCCDDRDRATTTRSSCPRCRRGSRSGWARHADPDRDLTDVTGHRTSRPYRPGLLPPTATSAAGGSAPARNPFGMDLDRVRVTDAVVVGRAAGTRRGRVRQTPTYRPGSTRASMPTRPLDGSASKRGASIAAWGSARSCTSRVSSCRWIGAWAWPPMVPNTRARRPFPQPERRDQRVHRQLAAREPVRARLLQREGRAAVVEVDAPLRDVHAAAHRGEVRLDQRHRQAVAVGRAQVGRPAVGLRALRRVVTPWPGRSRHAAARSVAGRAGRRDATSCGRGRRRGRRARRGRPWHLDQEVQAVDVVGPRGRVPRRSPPSSAAR